MSDVASLTIRPCTADDIPTVLVLARVDEERVSGLPSRLVEGDVRDWWQSVDLASNSWLLVPHDTEAGAGVVWADGQGTALGIGAPIAAEQEVLPVLVDLVERRAVELGLERLRVLALVPDPPAAQLLEERGYQDVRHFF